MNAVTARADAGRAVDRLLARLDGVKQSGRDQWQARCPAHDDRTPSLSIRAIEGQVLLFCHAGCPTAGVVSALGLDVSDLFDDPHGATYSYADGRRVHRSPDKQFRQSGNTKPPGKAALYHTERLPAAVGKAATIYACEGEKDCHALESLGAVATCSPMGAGKAHRADWAPLTGAEVVVVADDDEPGRKHAADVASILRGQDCKVRVVRSKAGKDAADHVAAGFGLDDFVTAPDTHYTPPNNTATAQPPPALAREPHILQRFSEAVAGCGVVGELATAVTLYLILTSRLLDKPVSAAVKGLSSSGKSFTTEKTVEFFPPDAVVVMTAMSQRALVYSKEEYAHRTLILYEATALREGAEDDLTAYFVRTLLSEGRIEYPVTVRDKEGGFTTKTIIKEGPTNLIVTTTKTRVHAENETRLLSLNTTDTRDQTKAIFRALASEHESDVDLSEWHQLQAWLQGAEHRVTIPFAHRLAELVPPVAVRLRRDFGALLALIRSHAILHQMSRERDAQGRIVATIEDYAEVRELVAPIVSEAVGRTVSARVRETVEAVELLAGNSGVMALAVGEHLTLDKSTVSRRLRMAADAGYIRNLEDKRGKPGRWVKGDPMPEEVDLLPQPRNLETAETRAVTGGCTVASDFQGVEAEAETEGFEV